MRVGDKIRIKKKYRKTVKALNRKEVAAKAAFEEASMNMASANKEMWAFLNKMYPELSRHRLMIDSEKGVITVLALNALPEDK